MSCYLIRRELQAFPKISLCLIASALCAFVSVPAAGSDAQSSNRLSSASTAPELDQLPLDEARRRIQRLRSEIAYHDDLYYRKSAPEISDAEYDELKRLLRKLERAYPEIAVDLPMSPDFGDDRTGAFPETRHRVPMLSLDKAYSESEVRQFLDRALAQARTSEVAFLVEPKIDGMAISVTYENGRFVRATTRGDGQTGDDITENARRIAAIPVSLRESPVYPFPESIELRGELFVTFADFAAINRKRESEGAPPFAHPRNYAAGSAKLSEVEEVSGRLLSVVFFGCGSVEPAAISPTSQSELYRQFEAWGLPVVAPKVVAGDFDELMKAVGEIEKSRATYPIPLDGAVIKIDGFDLQRALGASSSAPRWAVAYKFPAERVETKLVGITLQVGRTGIVTPVAELEPIELDGTRIARATLSNARMIRRSDIRIGDIVYLEKAGEVIPAIVGVNLGARSETAESFAFPANCPSCNEILTTESDGAITRCDNLGCPAQLHRRLEHFASSGAVDIGGLGPATIQKLVESRTVSSIADLYRLDGDKLDRAGLGTGLTATSLLESIETSRSAPLWRVIHGLSIPEIGAKRAESLCLEIGSLAELAALASEPQALRNIATKAGMGPATIDSLQTYFSRPDAVDQIAQLGKLGLGQNEATEGAPGKDRPLAEKSFVVTGTLHGYTRAEVTAMIERAGGTVRSQVGGATDYLVVGESPGSKLDRARELGVKTLTLEQLLELIDL